MHLIMGWLVPEEKPYLAWLTTTLEFRFGLYVWLMLLCCRAHLVLGVHCR